MCSDRAATADARTSGQGPSAHVGDSHRTELFEALVRDPRPGDGVIADLARAAKWPLPDTVVAIALAPAGRALRRVEFSGNILTSPRGEVLCLLLPNPHHAMRILRHGVEGHTVAAGPVVVQAEARQSLTWAIRLLEFVHARGASGVVHVTDHLSELILLQDEFLFRTMAALRLRPLAGLSPKKRAKLSNTLLAWLERGGVSAAAQALDVHPQTVAYRMREIEKLFGPALGVPRVRLELELALKGHRLFTALGVGGPVAEGCDGSGRASMAVSGR